MLDKVLSLKNGNNSVNEFCSCIRQGIPVAAFGVTEAFKSFLISCIDEKVLLIAKDTLSATKFCERIKEFSNKKTAFIPPKDETLLVSKAFSKDSSFARIKGLDELSSAEVVVTTIEALMQICPKKIDSVVFEKDLNFSIESAVKKLVSLGYKRLDVAESKGTFSLRGDVIDVCPIDNNEIIRIEFFDDVIENVKIIDAETRRNKGNIPLIKILQASEFIFDENDFSEYKSIIRNEIENSDKEQALRRKIIRDDLYLAMETFDNDGLNRLACISKNSGGILDLLPDNLTVVFDEAKSVYDLAVLVEKEFSERYVSLEKAGEVFSFAKNNLLPLESLVSNLKKYRQASVQMLSTAIPFFNPLKIINPTVSGIVNYQLDFKEVFTDVDNWLRGGYTVLICTGDNKRSLKMSYEFSDRNILHSLGGTSLKGAIISDTSLDAGFVFHEEKLAVIGSGNLFKKTDAKTKIKSKKGAFFTAPESGDYCVHEVHGVGRVLGNKRISTTEGTKDYVGVEYSGGDVLYVPVEQLDILTRYLGAEKKPKLSKIGGQDFERIKRAVKESIRKMSIDLKKLYAERKERLGYQFTIYEELEREFNLDFPFEETPDQLQAEAEIKEDMSSSLVMDRLICGDVGFGKTEVALRAVFRAVANGKQAVMLAPTTILSEQHYSTACERFKRFGIKIACLNRFRKPSEQKKILEGLKNGEVDFIIGTHRLLTKDVEFKDLGLLVLDEEQRFGVEHKEKIKLIKNNVDTLTLTATPIPRTLHMSLSGIRSISVINTPPKKRLPVQTYVTEETEVLIKDAVYREINRGGQVFVLYNRVESIDFFASRLKKFMPEVRTVVAHGQMDERTLEKNILDFYAGKYDLLISTTIIENGIDLPKANTLIVIDADNLGLSTLYQLKGRVGRSNRLAYAYFTFKRDKILTKTAYERLNTIIEFTEMGSGIKIAMRDLEIRGAGNILGAEQHGHMDKIGYELYSKLLKEELSGTEEKMPDLDVRISAYIPEKYIENNTSKMSVYKEIAEMVSFADELEIKNYLTETYGAIPKETLNLIDVCIVKRLAMKVNAKKITVSEKNVSITFEDFKIFGSKNMQNAMDEFSDRVRISMAIEPTLEFLKQGESNRDMLGLMREFLTFATKS